MLFGTRKLHHTYLPHDAVWDQQITLNVPTPWCCLGSADYITRTYPMMLFGTSRLHHTYHPHDAVWDQQITSHVPTPWCCLGSADYITRTYPIMLFGASECPHTYLPRNTVRHQQMKSHCAYMRVNAHKLIWYRQWRFDIVTEKTRQTAGLGRKYDHGNLWRRWKWNAVVNISYRCDSYRFTTEQASSYTRLILTDQNCSPSSPLSKKSNQSVSQSVSQSITVFSVHRNVTSETFSLNSCTELNVEKLAVFVVFLPKGAHWTWPS